MNPFLWILLALAAIVVLFVAGRQCPVCVPDEGRVLGLVR